MIRLMKLAFVTMFIFLLSGCLYPDEMKRDSNASVENYVSLVQNAIEKYNEETGVLPIKNSEPDTPIYEKYQINFESLVPRYLEVIPENDFVKGGHHLYVLVDVETKPIVKLLDLQVSKSVRNAKQSIDQFRLQNNNKLPSAEQVTDGVYAIDFKKMRTNVITATSPYSNQSLPLYVTEDGEVIVDYSIDIFSKMKEEGTVEGDLRQILVNHSYFVPSHSLPYKEVNGEPVIDVK